MNVNIDEYSYCSYHADGRYRTVEYMQDGVVYAGLTNSWTTFSSSSNRPNFMSSFLDNSNYGSLDMGRFYIYLASGSYQYIKYQIMITVINQHHSYNSNQHDISGYYQSFTFHVTIYHQCYTNVLTASVNPSSVTFTIEADGSSAQ